MRARFSRRAWLAVAAALATITTMVGVPLTAAPASASTDAWTLTGPAGATDTVLSDGSSDSDPSFNYWYCADATVAPGAHCDEGGTSGAWTFGADTAPGETQVTGTYLWTGNHAFCAATAELQPFVVTTGGTEDLSPIVDEGNNCDANDGASPIDGPFEFAGTYTFNLTGVSQYGFYLTGSNGDAEGFLEGTFTYATASPPPAPPTQVVATRAYGAVDLNWSAPAGPAPSSYLVFEGSSSGGELPGPVATVNGTATSAQAVKVPQAGTDQGPEPDSLSNTSPYYFTVAAVYGAPVYGYTSAAAGSGAPALVSPPSTEASAPPVNLVQNGSFENPPVTPCDAYGCPDQGFVDLLAGSSTIPDWTIGGDSVDLTNNHWQAEDGSQSVDLAGGAPGSLSQTVTTVPGQTYTLSWWMAGNPDNGAGIKTMDVYWDGSLVDQPSFNTAGHTDASMGWVEEQVNLTARSTSTTVEFADASSPDSAFGATLDNVVLLPASLPSCSSSSLTDDFALDASLSDCWQTGTSVITSVAADEQQSVGASGTSLAPDLAFNGSDLDMQGVTGEEEFTGIQSAEAYSAPLQFQTSVAAVHAYGNPFEIYLYNPSTNTGFTVDGNTDPDNTPYYGLWGSATIGANENNTALLSTNTPNENIDYSITISVDGAGNGTVTVSYPGGGSTTTPIGNAGTGPFYVVLGQWAGSPTAGTQGGTTNEAAWYSASLNSTAAPVTATLSASSATVAGVETVPASVVPTSALGTTSSSSNGAASIQLGSIQLGSSQLGSIQLGSIPLAPIYAAGTATGAPSGLQAAAQALSSSLLSDIGITYPQGCSGSSCTGWAGVLAGSIYANVPLEAVTLADVLTDTTPGSGGQLSPAAAFNSVNLGSLNLASSQLGSIQLGSIQLGSIQLGSIGLDGSTPGPSALAAWCSALAGLNPPVSCSNFGITPDSNGALSNPDDVTLLTLALAGVQLGSIQLGSIQLGSIQLGSIQLGSIQLGSIQLGSIQLGSINLANNPILSVPLGSVPDLASTQLGSIQLGSIQLGSIQLGSIQLGSIQLGSIQLGSIQLGSIQLGSIGNLAAICSPSSSFTCSSTSTLLDAFNAGAITTLPVQDLPTNALDSMTLGQLAQLAPNSVIGTTLAQLPASDYSSVTLSQLLSGDNTSYPGYPNPLTLADLLLTTVPPASYPWQSVNLSSLPLAANATGGGDETYTASITSASAQTAQISVTLPTSFAYVPGSTTLNGGAAADPSSGPPLSWTLPLNAGQNALSFEVAAGIGLGPATATLSVTAGGATATSPATVDVVDGEQPAITSASTALALTPGTPDSTPVTQGNLNIGYLTSAGDLNDWAVTVTAGEELSLALSNFPAADQYDLELFGPGVTQLQGAPSQDLPGVNDTLPSLASEATTEQTPGSQDLPVTPPAGDQLEAISNNPAGQAQYIQTTPLTAGTYIVQVSGYDGAFSSQPYLLQANLLGGATSPSCPGGISYLSSLGTATPPPVNIPSGVNTLFLVDTQRLTAAFGASSEATIMSDLEEVTSGTGSGGQPGETGVDGAIVPVDAYSTVQNAYAQWNSNPCSVAAANAVVAAIAAVVDQIRANNPTVQNVVIVGGDDQVPFARVPDGATQANERDYGQATFAGLNNVEGDALSLGYYFSDDPYVSNQPLGVGSATLYTPQLAVGRLVESATEIEAALTRFVSSNGNLDATSSLTTGYSFLTAGATEVSANLAANGITPKVLAPSISDLIGPNWQEPDLDNALASPTPSVISLNAHFDYSRALPGYDNTNNLTTNLFTTQDVSNPTGIGAPASSFAGTLLFSMGCHSGLDIDDAEVDASVGVTQAISDWAKAFADAGALWVGNTGYGYADTDTIAYSAKLMAGFAASLNGSLTIGEALTEAKQQYAAGNAILSPYDLKALMESTFYGLPMYTLNGPAAPVTPPTGPTTTTDGPTGLKVASLSVNFGTSGNPSLENVTASNGDYYQVQVGPGSTYSGGTQTTEFRPIEPLVSVPATEPGLVAHGALVTALSSTDSADPTPAYSLPAAGAADATPPVVGDAAFPGTLQRVATYSTFTSTGTSQGAQLDLVAGQFLPNPSAPGSGTQRLFTSISAQVYYLPPSSPLVDDYTPATIDSSQATTAPDSAPSFDVQVTPSSAPVDQVLVLYTDGGDPGTWTGVSLSSANGLTWTGTGPVATANGAQYIVEAVDAAGNVAVSNNEGVDFNGAAQPAVSITLAGSGPVNGYYTGTVTAGIAAPSGSTYVLDGAEPQPVPVPAQLAVSSAGEHTLTVTDQNGDTATQAFAISDSQTTTTWSSSPSAAVVGQPVSFTAAVAAASSSAGAPTGAVEFFDGTSPISACGGTAGEGLVAGLATCTVSYSAPGTHQITAGYVGSSAFAASGSPTAGLTVSPDSATVSSFSATGGPATYGKETGLVFSATVTAANGVPVPATDTVAVSAGPTALCTIVLGTASGSSASGSCSPSSGTALPAGTYTNGITATFNSTGADPDFLAAPPATASLTVAPAALVVTASSGSMTYGGTVPSITPSYSGFAAGQTAANLTTLPTCSTTATNLSPVSTYSASCGGAVDSNYTISYSNGSVVVKPASLVVTASSGSMTYGGTVPTITASYSGFENGDGATNLTTKPTCSTTATSASPVKTYPSSCTGAVDANYTISYVAGTVTVGPATLVITGSNGSMIYGGSVPTITPSYSGFENGDNASKLTVAPTCSTTATSASPVGSYASVCKGAVDANYTISYVPGTVTVNPAPLTITASNGSMTYGGTPPTITPSYSGFVNKDSATNLTTRPTCSTTATSASPVGSYASVCKGAVDANYTISYVPGTVTVNPAPLTIRASNGSMTYGGTPPTITPSYSGFVNGDSASKLTTAPNCSTTANSSSQPGTYASMCSGAVDANYAITYVNGAVTVGFTQACLTSTDNGSLTVAKGQAICIGSGGRVTGSVSVAAGGALWVSGGSIGGSVSSAGALGVTLSGTTVTGSVSVTGTSGPVLLGGSGCAKDTFGGSVSLSGNPDGVVLSGDAVTGSVTATSNGGGTSVSANTVTGSLTVSTNTGGTTISANTVTGSLTVSTNSGGTTISTNRVTGSGSVTSNTGGLAFTNNTLSGSLTITNNTGPFTYSGNTVHGSVTNTGNT
jgi:choice-of-anchor C domain-containing protein